MLERTPLNNDWRYAPDFRDEYINPGFDDAEFQQVRLPHANTELDANYVDETTYQFDSCYRTRFSFASLVPPNRAIVRFDGVMVAAWVYCNGRLCGEHLGGYTAFEVDITDAVRPGEENVLVVHVDSHERPDTPPFGNVVDYLTFGGIYREVTLEVRDAVYVESAILRTSDVLTKDAMLSADLFLVNRTDGEARVALVAELVRDGTVVQSNEWHVDAGRSGRSRHSLSWRVGEVMPWSPADPALYSLRLTARRDGHEAGTYAYRFGFREIDWRPDGLRINGEQIRLLGLNRHQSYPFVGYAMPASAQRKDAEILKDELGVNIVRCSHYPQSRHFLDRCDELGLLVFDEIPGWQHIGDEAWQGVAIENVREMITTNANHPSIVIWGVRINESQDNDAFYAKTNALARDLDPSRPTGGVRYLKKSSFLEDVYTYNDFVHAGGNQGLVPRKESAGNAVPYLVTEHNGHMFPTKAHDSEAHRLSQAKRHLAVLKDMYADPDISGAIGWCMADYYTHRDFGSGDRICYHGVMDMFRTPKLAASLYASQQDDRPVLEVSSTMNIGEHPGSALGDLYVLTNCDFVRLSRNGRAVRDFYPDHSAHPGMPHPPIVVDDLVGQMLHEDEAFSSRDAGIAKALMHRASKVGMNIGFWNKLRLGLLMLRNRMSFDDVQNLYIKYYGGWGDAAVTYEFTGFSDGVPVKTVRRGQSPAHDLVLRADTTALTEADTYDVTRIVVELQDADGNVLPYGSDAFSIETSGPVELIGPRLRSLSGGSTAFWVRTIGEPGTATVSVWCDRLGAREVRIAVQ